MLNFAQVGKPNASILTSDTVTTCTPSMQVAIKQNSSKTSPNQHSINHFLPQEKSVPVMPLPLSSSTHSREGINTNQLLQVLCHLDASLTQLWDLFFSESKNVD